MSTKKQPQSVIQEVLYQKAIGERIWTFTGELGGKYISRSTEQEIQQVIVTDPKTGDITVMNLPLANIIRIQPKRLL